MVTTDINHIRKISKKSNLLRPYDEWVGLFRQVDANPPEFVKLIHTTFPDIITIDWVYKDPGDYKLTLNYYNNLVSDNSLMEITCNLGSSEIVDSYYTSGISISCYFQDSVVYTAGSLFFLAASAASTVDVRGYFTLTIKRYYQ
jgi:hypothetical protein